MQVFPKPPRARRRTRLNFSMRWRKPAPLTVLVIGGAGYIGSALLPKLLNNGHRVRLLDRMFYGFEPIRDTLHHPNLEIMQADFRRIDKLVECMEGVDAVIHLGAIVGDPACALDRDLTIEVNLIATRTIAEVAKGYGIRRFIFASTCSVYGTNAGEELLTEESPLNPLSLYAVTKLASERLLEDMATETFSPTILRLSTIYGLSGRTRFDLVVNLLTAKAVIDGQITIRGGEQWRPLLHVDDAALAMLKTLEAPLPSIHTQIFNVGSDEQNYTIQQIGELIQQLAPNAELVNQGSGGDRRDYRASFRKIREQLGFVPQWTVEQGVNQIIDVIRRGEVKDYRTAKYSNVKFLTAEVDTVMKLIHHESSWAYDLVGKMSILSLPIPASSVAA
jgi:nucleoside-diphosphate-sugar epimerase